MWSRQCHTVSRHRCCGSRLTGSGSFATMQAQALQCRPLQPRLRSRIVSVSVRADHAARVRGDARRVQRWVSDVRHWMQFYPGKAHSMYIETCFINQSGRRVCGPASVSSHVRQHREVFCQTPAHSSCRYAVASLSVLIWAFRALAAACSPRQSIYWQSKPKLPATTYTSCLQAPSQLSRSAAVRSQYAWALSLRSTGRCWASNCR